MTDKAKKQLENQDRTREVKNLDGSVQHVRKVAPSDEALKKLGMASGRTVVGHFAINPPHIEKKIRLEKAEIMRSMALMKPAEREAFIDKGPIDFADHKGKTKYTITCARCSEPVAYAWADDENLNGWCDLHYLCRHDDKSWYGAMAINVSPIDGKIGIECACGEDTRDYRGAKHLPPIQKQLMTEYSQKHRDFGTKDSSFVVTG